MKPTAILRNWTILKTKPNVICLMADVYADVKGRWPDGTRVCIHDIEYFEDNLMITSNGIFLLED